MTWGKVYTFPPPFCNWNVQKISRRAHLPTYFLDYRERVGGEDRWNDRGYSGDGYWSGNIYDFYFRIYYRITAEVKTPFSMGEDGMTRVEETPVNCDA